MVRSSILRQSAFLLITIIILTACAPTTKPTIEATSEPIQKLTIFPPTDTPKPPTATPEPTIGSPEHPIKILMVPSVENASIITIGKTMAAALKEATGLEFVIVVPDSYLATIEEICSSPTDTIGFLSSTAYVIANQVCGVDVAFTAKRYGNAVYRTQFLVNRDSSINSIQDLNEKKWGYTDQKSPSGYLVPLTMMSDGGIKPGESIETGGHPQSVKAIYKNEVDFSTSYYIPPKTPDGQPAWIEGEAPDVPDNVVASCAPTADGKSLKCSEWEILDARSLIRTEVPDIIQKVRIAFVSPGIPNDTISFSPEFSKEMRAQICESLLAYSQTDDWKETFGSEDHYNWTGIVKATDTEYDFVRKMVKVANITLKSLGK